MTGDDALDGSMGGDAVIDDGMTVDDGMAVGDGTASDAGATADDGTAADADANMESSSVETLHRGYRCQHCGAGLKKGGQL